ncbi:MAG: glutamyl-tRNA reductase [Candidatus Dormibacteraeota bacterium]|nr:glutamyl-tRNA reductase [Candidatus Dormibacteraeota bacterium]MBV9526279.1 glutamyl-tRNA reductase [Candidatus Dormibacteraeota bacterium]
MMRVVAAGLSHRTAPLAVREAAAVPVEQARTVLRYLVGHAGFSAAAVLSTCNRTEFYVTCAEPDVADVVPRLAPYLDAGGDHDVLPFLTQASGRDAVEHLFRIAAGLESMVVGETQVLGQLKDAHELARSAGTLDARLDFVLRRAISVGKQVHTDTGLGRGASNLSDAAVACARTTAGDLRGRGVLLLGAGVMSTLAARTLREMGAHIMVSSRGESRQTLATAFDGEAVALDALVEAAERIDAIIACTASGETVLDAPTVAAMQRRRAHRPLSIVDIAVPRDVDAAAAVIDGVTLIDIDELGRRLDSHMLARRDAVAAAERVIETELRRTMTVIGQRDAAGPTISALNRRAEALRRREVERAIARAPHLDVDARERIDMLTSSLVRKLLHGPITHLRETVDDPSVALTIRQAFDLDDHELKGSPAPHAVSPGAARRA